MTARSIRTDLRQRFLPLSAPTLLHQAHTALDTRRPHENPPLGVGWSRIGGGCELVDSLSMPNVSQ